MDKISGWTFRRGMKQLKIGFLGAYILAPRMSPAPARWSHCVTSFFGTQSGRAGTLFRTDIFPLDSLCQHSRLSHSLVNLDFKLLKACWTTTLEYKQAIFEVREHLLTVLSTSLTSTIRCHIHFSQYPVKMRVVSQMKP